jgi:phage terminase large subunit-like protein
MLAWRTVCKDETSRIEDFYGQPAIVGLDLASESDVAAKTYLFWRNGKLHVFGRYYLPEDALDKGNPNYDIYRGWAEHDYLTLTPGGATDFEFIERDLLEDRDQFHIEEVGYDPAQAFYLVTRLMSMGFRETLIKVPQQVTVLSDPMKEVAKRILGGKIIHNGDPVLDWMMGNVVAKIDAKENVYPRKARAENKIDGAVALIIAMNRHLLRTEQAPSIYETAATCVI